jgi:hypothetical protein
MKKQMIAIALAVGAILLSQCRQETSSPTTSAGHTPQTQAYAGFESQVKWGEHLITVSACHDCHTPKIITAEGMMLLDSSRLLSGHPAGMPAPQVDRAELERKGQTTTDMLTAWVGPWGISYAANLSSDDTGTGTWSEAQFMTAIRKGKFKGLEGSRQLLPPMPWEVYRYMTDDELKAIFAYLKSTKPVRNVVPAPEPPVSASISSK